MSFNFGNLLDFPFGLGSSAGSNGNFAAGDHSNVKSFADEVPFSQILHGIWNDFTGVTGQRNLAEDERQWSEYFYNEYQSPSAMVDQYRLAGLNPNMLNGAGQVSPPSASTPAVSSPASAIGSLASAVQSVGSLAQNQQNIEQNERRLLNDIDISQFGKRLTEAQTYSAFMKGGYDSELSRGVAISNYWANDQNIADLAIKWQNRDNMQKEWSLIQANTDFVNKQISRYDEMIDAELDLKQKQSLEAEKHAFQMEQQAKQTQLENDFFEKYNYHSDSPIDVGLRNKWQSGDFEEYYKMLSFALDYGYKKSLSEGVATAYSSRFGKIDIWEFPSEIVRYIDEWATDFDKKHSGKLEMLKTDLNELGGILKNIFYPVNTPDFD